MNESLKETAEYVIAIPQLVWQSLAVACLLVFWFVALKPLLAKRSLPVWRQIVGGLAFGAGLPSIFWATAMSLGPLG